VAARSSQNFEPCCCASSMAFRSKASPLHSAPAGFLPNETVHNTQAALRGLELTFVVLPIAFVVLSGLTLVGYRLNAVRHNEIRSALAVRDSA
jgi:Na+/melibiose symporter-like transporter